MNKYIFVFLATLLFSSCSTRKEIVYFQDIEKVKGMEIGTFEPVFEINDILHIRVTSQIEDVAEPFQMRATGGLQAGGGQNNPSLIGYLVDVNGYIQFPVLGQVKAVGKSRSELESYLTEEIRKYVTDAVVAVRLLNFRVVVLGETGSQTVVQVPNERMTVPELLATVGGINYTGKRQNILVIREDNGKLKYGYVNMTEADLFKNPYYFLKQNDIVYVEPTYRQVKSAGWITSYQGILSLITSAISLYFIFSNF